VKGTPGAVDPADFRERAGETALVGKPSESLASPVNRFARGRFRMAAGRHLLPDDVQHRFMTGGVRVKQVGVNPLGERSHQRGVANAFRAKRPLACGNSVGGSRKGGCLSVARWLAAAPRSRFGSFVGVFVGLPAAEVGRRHVA
jgi:hypothetical protein